MYLQEIYLENTGPISKCHVKLPFDDNGNPHPVVMVGPNGVGKTTFLSYIADALTEFGKKAFNDIVPTDGSKTPYFRVIHPRAIRSGQPFSLSLLRFKANSDNPYYCEKSGILDQATNPPDLEPIFRPVWKWPMEGNYKDVSVNQKTINTEMQDGAHAFFPSSRREVPAWLNPRSLRTGMNAPVNQRFSDELGKPIHVETCAEEIISWILDVLFDASIDFDIIGKLRVDSSKLVFHNLSPEEKERWNNLRALQLSLQNIEQILQEVLRDKQAKLLRRLRNNSERRLSIQLGNGQEIPNLQSLSEGESQLFHLFATIIRYGERTDLNRSVHLSEIMGLVMVDEIDAHLHPTFQHDVLPKLIKLFPKVQFIVSSHSPLFLLGMEEEFGPDRVAILELPDGDRINSEKFSEFGIAFECYQNTERFEQVIKQRFANMTKPIVLTEGKTDARYIQTALALLGEEELLDSVEVRPVGSDGDKELLPGGTSGLEAFRKTYATHPSYFHHPILLLCDCDVKKIPEPVEKLSVKSIPSNGKNTKVKGGIENLFPAEVFQDCFYDKKVIKKNDGGQRIEEDLNKPKFCKWICENGSATDFEKFRGIVKILKEFVEAHQSSANQQSMSE